MSAPGLSIGVDVVRISEFERLSTRPWFLRFVYAQCELTYADSVGPSRRREFLAGRFAAKEAALKVLRTGLFREVTPSQIAVDRTADGAPVVRLSGAAAEAASALALAGVAVSISHKEDVAAAVAIAVPASRPPGADGGALTAAQRAASEVCRKAAAGTDEPSVSQGREWSGVF